MTLPRPKPFLFTRWLPSPELLHSWLAHFSHHDAPAGIVSRKRGPGHYAVWRYGVEATGENILKSECISYDMRVEESINGFEELFNKAKEEVLGDQTRIHEVERSAESGPGTAARLEIEKRT